ncbi:UNVERIFIED_CONTAM: hypothetical protein FKN15_026461 [Acipenser sinensis]
MDQWLWYNPEPSRNRWDGGLEDFFGGLEEEGWCLACGEFGHLVACCPFQEEEDLLPAQKRKRRRGGRSRRRTKEPGPSPVWKMEVVPTIAQSERAPLPQPERAPPPNQAFLQFFGDEFLRLLLVRFVFCSATMRLHKVFRETRNYPETYPQLPKEETVENPMVQKHVLELASILDVQNLFCDNTLDDY